MNKTNARSEPEPHSLWFNTKCTLDKVLRRLRHILEQILREIQRTLRDIQERLLLGVAAERTAAGQQHVRQHTDRPDVGGQAERLVLEHLRRHVVRGAENLAHFAHLFDEARDAEVAQFQAVWRGSGEEEMRD